MLRARWRPRYNLGWRSLLETTAEPEVYRSYNHHALGLARCSRTRKTVEPLRVRSSRIVARRRDLRQIKWCWTHLCRAVDKTGKIVDLLLRAKQWFRWAFKNEGATVVQDRARGLVSRRAAREVLEQHGARRLRSTASNSCIASGNVNSPRAYSGPLEKTAPEIRSTAPPDPNERQSPMTWPFVNLHDILRRSAPLKICDLRC